MNQTKLEEIATLLSNHILNDCALNYYNSPTGNLIDEETWCSGDFDEYVHDLIKEWDYLNNDILSNMKTGPFETDGTDTMRDMIYRKISDYCEFSDETIDKANKNGRKIGFSHFANKLEQVKDKEGSYVQKLKSAIKDFV